MSVIQAAQRFGGDTLSNRLRTETLDAHEAAERAVFVQELMGGELPLEGYIRLVAQHHEIYRVLETAVAANTDPDLEPFLDPALNRHRVLTRDLVFLAGEQWRERFPILPGTAAYAEHIRRRSAQSSAALLAHHYIRYLGDLSGGQVIGRVLRRIYGFDSERGIEFYAFTDIDSPKRFKDDYRDRLDALGWDAATVDTVVDEVNTAYELNTAVFNNLARVGAEDL